MRAASAAFCVLLLAASAFAAEKLPPAPTRYFTQYTNVVSPQVAERLNAKLDAFERETSIQLLVAIYPRLPENSVLEDFTVRTAQAWMAGGMRKDNGAVLFVFVSDRKMRIEVGYGLEGAIPDAVAKRIIEEQIKPAFARGDFDAGVTAGVNALMQASRGEYRGTGRTVGDKNENRGLPWPLIIFLLIFFASMTAMRRSGTGYHRRRRSYWGGWPGGWGGGGWGGGGWSGGSSGGGGVFSGGGGRFGGGGASGSW